MRLVLLESIDTSLGKTIVVGILEKYGRTKKWNMV